MNEGSDVAVPELNVARGFGKLRGKCLPLKLFTSFVRLKACSNAVDSALRHVFVAEPLN